MQKRKRSVTQAHRGAKPESAAKPRGATKRGKTLRPQCTVNIRGAARLLRSTAAANPSNELCEPCEEVIQFSYAPYGERRYLGSSTFAPYLFLIFEKENDRSGRIRYWEGTPIKTTGEKPRCPLCRLCLEAWRRSNLERDLGAHIRFALRPFSYYEDFPCQIQLAVGRVNQSVYHSISRSLIPLGDGEPRSRFLACRLGSDRDVLGVAREWIKGCKSHKGDCDALTVRQRAKERYESSNFRLIDTQDMCVILGSTTWTYFALSYVWGFQTSNFKTTIANLKVLLQQGGLKQYWNEIPLTIRDAITVVSELGYRYLWVDSICIVQDDEEVKEHQIKHMDSVYLYAFCTIIAGSGNDANSGLAGVRPRSRTLPQCIEEVKLGISYAIVVDDSGIVPQLQYSTRAWTYQELLFSRRRLIFTDEILAYQCREAFLREDVLIESKVPKRNGGAPANLAVDMLSGDPLSTFGDLVTEYSNRTLTNVSDIMNAFRGITNVLEDRLRYKFHFGLPTRAIDWSLLFLPKRSKFQTRRIGFPSWSWVGWIGGSSFNNCYFVPWIMGLEEWNDLHTWIVWYCRDGVSGYIEPLWKPDLSNRKRPTWSSRSKSNRSWMEERPFIAKSDITAPTGGLLPTSDNSSDHTGSLLDKAILLQFWTVSVQFRCAYLGDGQEIQTENVISLHDTHGNKAGEVSVGEVWKNEEHEMILHEFILLSGFIDADDQDQKSRGGPVTRPNGYNIMLIKWHQAPNKPYIAERMGLGILHHDGIYRSFKPGPIWKEIILG